MKYLGLLLGWLTIAAAKAMPIEPVLVSEQSFKINGEQRFFYAFEAGDQILFDLELLKGNLVKEVEIAVHKGGSCWRAERLTTATQKSLTVPKRAIYVFRIRSGGSKTVSLKIRRVPVHSSRTRFNPYVRWKTVVDTLRPHFRLEQTTIYDTTYQTHYRRILYKKSQQMTTLLSRTERVSSHTNLQHDNETSVMVELPVLQQNEQIEERFLGGAYWIGVGQEGLEHYNKELKKFLASAASKIMSHNLLAGLAVGAYAVAVNPPQGDNIVYQLWSQSDKSKKLEAAGNVTAAFGRFVIHKARHLSLDLKNDNLINGLNIHLKLVVVTEQKHYRQEAYQERIITPLVQSEIKGKVHLVERQIPIIDFW